jgi:hypothetical protein
LTPGCRGRKQLTGGIAQERLAVALRRGPRAGSAAAGYARSCDRVRRSRRRLKLPTTGGRAGDVGLATLHDPRRSLPRATEDARMEDGSLQTPPFEDRFWSERRMFSSPHLLPPPLEKLSAAPHHESMGAVCPYKHTFSLRQRRPSH